MKTIDPNVVGVIHLRGWPASGNLASRLAAVIYGPNRRTPLSCRNDRFSFDDHSVFAETAKLRHELDTLYAAVMSR